MVPIDADPDRPPPELAPCGDLLRGARVLVVDDERLVLSVVARMLRRCGAETFTASTVGDAERILNSPARPFALIVVDVFLPDGSGFDLAASLDRAHPNAAVVLMSGWAAQGPSSHPTAAPMLTKPFTADRLYDAVQAALSARSRSA
jgi:DNA-binding NtrC family response regulator